MFIQIICRLKKIQKKVSSSLTSCRPCLSGPCRSKAASITCLAAGDEPESSNLAPLIARLTKTMKRWEPRKKLTTIEVVWVYESNNVTPLIF
jgi:hypothetical protein